MRHGLWYATALCLNWVLGAVSYYLIPSMGPAFVAPAAVLRPRADRVVVAAARAVGGAAQRALRLRAGAGQGRRAEHRGLRVPACFRRADGGAHRPAAAGQPLAAPRAVDLLRARRASRRSTSAGTTSSTTSPASLIAVSPSAIGAVATGHRPLAARRAGEERAASRAARTRLSLSASAFGGDAQRPQRAVAARASCSRRSWPRS